MYVTFEKGFGRLGGKGLHKTVVGVRQIEGHEVRRLLDAGNHHQGRAEIGLRFAWRVRERHKHLLAAQL
jgi:hypothetical protein